MWLLVCECRRREVGSLGSGLFAGDSLYGALILDLVVEEPDEVAKSLLRYLIK